MQIQSTLMLILGLAALGIASPILEPKDVSKRSPEEAVFGKYGKYADENEKRSPEEAVFGKYGKYEGAEVDASA